MTNPFPSFHNWTLFLDRDGVINRRIPGRYVRFWEQFDFIDGVLAAIPKFRQVFSRIIIVTNQQGVAKGLLSNEELILLHNQMIEKIEDAGGLIDKVYFAPQLASENSADRKPGPGMALKAQLAFPDIDFKKSVMVGDSMSDIQFGKNLGMFTVHIAGKVEEIGIIDHSIIDLHLEALKDLIEFI